MRYTPDMAEGMKDGDLTRLQRERVLYRRLLELGTQQDIEPFLREALDTRVRSAEVIGERLELPLLGRLPVPPRDLRMRNELVMMGDPRSWGDDPSAFERLTTWWRGASDA